MVVYSTLLHFLHAIMFVMDVLLVHGSILFIALYCTFYMTHVSKQSTTTIPAVHNMPFVCARCMPFFECMIADSELYTVYSPNNGHFGTRASVLYSESVLYWGVL